MRYLLQEPIKKICEYSGEEFFTKNNNQKYASHNYAVLAWNKNNAEKLKEIRKRSDAKEERKQKKKDRYLDPEYRSKYNKKWRELCNAMNVRKIKLQYMSQKLQTV